jgi:hypothetical protein
VMVSEDFGLWGLQGRIPTCMFWLGGADPEEFAASLESGKSLPSIHSPLFAPLPEPSIATAVTALSLASLELLAAPDPKLSA